MRPYDGSKPYCFVSYSHKDLSQVGPYLSALEERGFRIWYDDGIHPGSEWAEEIAAHLEASSAYIVFLSPDSIESVYVRSEINRAIALRKEILCVFLSPCELSAGLKLQLGIYRSVHAYRFEDSKQAIDLIMSSLSDRLHSPEAAEKEASVQIDAAEQDSEADKKLSPKRSLIIALLLLAVMIAAGLLIWSRNRSAAASPTQAAETPEPIPIPEETLWGDWTLETEPTCDQEGLEIRTSLDDPSETQSRSIPALEHDWADASYSKPRTCTRCGKEDGEPAVKTVAPTAEELEALLAEIKGGNSDMAASYRTLVLPEREQLLEAPYRAKVSQTRSGKIYLLPAASTASHGIDTIEAMEEGWIVCEYGTYRFFVADNGKMGWNDFTFFITAEESAS